MKLEGLTPLEIVAELDKYIIGQDEAKKAVAIALRNRIRRQALPKEMQDEIAPKNIIMIGPTGVGKTEIARRLARLANAPFIKIEATKYTEVGYVGRDVESMVRDLMSDSLATVLSNMRRDVMEKAKQRTEEVLLDVLLPKPQKENSKQDAEEVTHVSAHTREIFRKKLRDGDFEDKDIEIHINKPAVPSIEVFSGGNVEELDINLGNLGNLLGNRSRRKKMSLHAARKYILQEEANKLINSEQAVQDAKNKVENAGIIFIDEIDKIAAKETHGADVSREGVQRDILPIVEGCKVNTKHGMIDTAHILFIAAGAFHACKPSDLIPELQGRFPIRVELESLDAKDFVQILTAPRNALIRQYSELLSTEGVTLNFTDEAISKIANIAEEVNKRTENIGARRLHTIMELLLQDISFNAPTISGQTVPITPSYISEKLANVVQNEDLSRYVL